jgi:ABC-type glycerol-3-phosphate transport system permease component
MTAVAQRAGTPVRPRRASARARAGRAESRVKTVLYVLAGILAVVVFVVPLLWFLLRSLQPGDTIAAAPNRSTFFKLSFDNFRGLASQGHILRAVGNSVIVAVSTAILTTLLATMAGYGFGRFRFRGSGVAFAVIVVTLMIPFQVAPGMATTALFAFLASWTEFLGALTFITRQDLFTLPVSLVNLQQGSYGQLDFGLLGAGAVIAMIPCVLLFVALQRFYVSGLSAGAVKG